MNLDCFYVYIILYYEDRSQIFIFDCLPNYLQIKKITLEFLGSFNEYQKCLIYQNIKKETFLIYDEDSYTRLINIMKIENLNKMQIYILDYNEFSIDIINNNIKKERNLKENSNIKEEILSEEGNSTSQMSFKNDNEKYGIKMSEKHIKTFLTWARMAKSKFKNNDTRLLSEDGLRRYNICTNIYNKNVSLVEIDLKTKKKIQSKQILIYRNSFNLNWSNDEGGVRLKNLIIYLIKNFNLINTFQDLSNF